MRQGPGGLASRWGLGGHLGLAEELQDARARGVRGDPA